MDRPELLFPRHMFWLALASFTEGTSVMISQISLFIVIFFFLFSSLLFFLFFFLSFPSPTALRYTKRRPRKKIPLFPFVRFWLFSSSFVYEVSLFIRPALLSHIPPFPVFSSLHHNHHCWKTRHANKFFTSQTIDVPDYGLSHGVPPRHVAATAGLLACLEERVPGGAYTWSLASASLPWRGSRVGTRRHLHSHKTETRNVSKKSLLTSSFSSCVSWCSCPSC